MLQDIWSWIVTPSLAPLAVVIGYFIVDLLGSGWRAFKRRFKAEFARQVNEKYIIVPRRDVGER